MPQNPETDAAAEAPEPSPLKLAADKVRSDSAALKLTGLSALQGIMPEEDPAEVLAGAAEAGYADILKAEGCKGDYYFSERFMTPAYATRLARVEDDDVASLIAETVRDESRIYPRPTPVAAFHAPPYSISPQAFAMAALKLGREAELSDIRSCSASDGSEYLFSTRYLSEDHAQGLAEYDAVGRWQNP